MPTGDILQALEATLNIVQCTSEYFFNGLTYPYSTGTLTVNLFIEYRIRARCLIQKAI